MIVYFSGTGNSAAVANFLADMLGDCVLRMKPGVKHMDLDDMGRIIWVFPVHSWGIPAFVKEFMDNVEISGACDAIHHLVLTCGDDCGETERMWRDTISRRGWLHIGNAFSVEMPNTYVAMPFFDVDSIEVRRRKLSAVKDRVNEIASVIESGRSGVSDIVRGRMPRLKTGVIYPWFMRHTIRPGAFRVDSKCVECGACAGICPMGNISLYEKRPRWGERCTGCLACYHICPRHSISYGPFTRGKGQYICPRHLEE